MQRIEQVQRPQCRIYPKFRRARRDYSSSSVTLRTLLGFKAIFSVSTRVRTKNIASKSNEIIYVINELGSTMKEQQSAVSLYWKCLHGVTDGPSWKTGKTSFVSISYTLLRIWKNESLESLYSHLDCRLFKECPCWFAVWKNQTPGSSTIKASWEVQAGPGGFSNERDVDLCASGA